MADVKPRIKLDKKQAKRGDLVEVKALVSHIMETGQRKDASGNTIPRKILNKFICTVNGKEVFSADFEPAIVDVASSGGAFVYRLGGRDFVDPTELAATLRQFPDKSAGAFVRVSDAAPYGMGATAVQAARDAGFDVVSYIPTGGAP